MGNYSVVWMVREGLTACGLQSLATSLPRDHIGSLYWLISAVVPGYEMFRYPAKWSVWMAAALALLAAVRLSCCESQRAPLLCWTKGLRWLTRGSACGLVLGLLAWLASGVGITADEWLSRIAPDVWMGPPLTRSIAIGVSFACAVPLLVLWAVRKIPSGGTSQGLLWITVIEMAACASCWISFVPPPEMESVRISEWPSNSTSVARLWSDWGAADFVRDQPGSSAATFANDQASYQQQFLLGKLASLADVACLNAAQSVEPLATARLRRWLARKDRLERDQPELDRVLRELGVTHRLVRGSADNSDDPAKYVWQAIADPQPLVQLIVDGRYDATAREALQWRWVGNDRIEIELGQTQAGELLIRQTNDGGWLAQASRDGLGAGRQTLLIAPHDLFLRIAVSTDDRWIVLSREW